MCGSLMQVSITSCNTSLHFERCWFGTFFPGKHSRTTFLKEKYMILKKPHFALIGSCVALASLGCATGAQAADDNGWYLGAGLGRSSVSNSGNAASNIDSMLGAQGLTSSTSISSSNTAGKLFGGYQFNRNWGLEGAYTDLGKFSVSSAISAPCFLKRRLPIASPPSSA